MKNDYFKEWKIVDNQLILGETTIFIPEIFALKFEKSEFGMEGWISFHCKNNSPCIYFWENKNETMSFLYNKLSQKLNTI